MTDPATLDREALRCEVLRALGWFTGGGMWWRPGTHPTNGDSPTLVQDIPDFHTWAGFGELSLEVVRRYWGTYLDESELVLDYGAADSFGSRLEAHVGQDGTEAGICRALAVAFLRAHAASQAEGGAG